MTDDYGPQCEANGQCEDIKGDGTCYGCGRWLGDDPPWNGMCPQRLHGLDYRGQPCDLCAKLNASKRPEWDRYFMTIADAVAARMSCDRARIGAVIVSPEHRILATGYGGAPSGWPSCDEVGHELVKINGRQSCIRTVHAEENAIVTAARYGVRLDGSTLYTTASTCYDCAKMVAQAGIKRIVYGSEYNSARSGSIDIVALLTARGIELKHLPLPERR